MPGGSTSSTADTQVPAVFCSMVSWNVVSSVLGVGRSTVPLIAGYSLGLASALHAAGALTVAETVRVVALRSSLAAAASDGSADMTALMLSAEDAHKTRRDVPDCWTVDDAASSG